MARVLGYKQIKQKRYKFLPVVPPEILHSFGRLTFNFTMTVWGKSGNGKSSFVMQFLKALMPFGKVLYVALEEGFEVTTQMNVIRTLNEEEHAGKIEFADHEMVFDELVKKLKKKKSPKFIVIDSVQYWNITFEQYKQLKELFAQKKTFIFISHAKGKEPWGDLAQKIRYDSALKAFVQGYVVEVNGRLGGNNPYIIWEKGAARYWGKRFNKIRSESKPTKEVIDMSEKMKAEYEKTSPPTPLQRERGEIVMKVV